MRSVAVFKSQKVTQYLHAFIKLETYLATMGYKANLERKELITQTSSFSNLLMAFSTSSWGPRGSFITSL